MSNLRVRAAARFTITTTLTGIDTAVNGTTLVLASTDANLQTWSWDMERSTIPAKYMPKN